ncbi:ORFS366W [Human betaherpesvirus 5]|nr:ORFS366W [Human betaherpesvirus 5]QHX40740.1 ORFS366W [Human betaherpesvirus 5]
MAAQTLAVAIPTKCISTVCSVLSNWLSPPTAAWVCAAVLPALVPPRPGPTGMTWRTSYMVCVWIFWCASFY